MSPGRRLAHTAAPGTSAPAATPAGCRVSERVAEAGSRGGARSAVGAAGPRRPGRSDARLQLRGALCPHVSAPGGQHVLPGARRAVRGRVFTQTGAALPRVRMLPRGGQAAGGPAPSREQTRGRVAPGPEGRAPTGSRSRPRPCAGGHGGAESGAGRRPSDSGLRRACGSRVALSGRPAP